MAALKLPIHQAQRQPGRGRSPSRPYSGKNECGNRSRTSRGHKPHHDRALDRNKVVAARL